MKILFGLILGILIGAGGMWVYPKIYKVKTVEIKKEYPLLKYTIENLSARTDWGSEIKWGEITATESGYIAQKFYFDSDGKKVSGLAHLPVSCDKCPVIVQFRGYYDREKYYPGAGTNRTAEEFVKEGYITLAPDFLGYGESASPSANVWEARFETYTTAANLLASAEKWERTKSIGIWAHSNGGQIGLTVLEIMGNKYPTVLWAPVTAPFPYSVLYYTFDYGDRGKELRRSLAEFERDYDVEKFTMVNYLDKITAPVLIQQGTVDPDVPITWSRDTAQKLRAEYMEYLGADHNMLPSWNEAVIKDLEFFEYHLNK